MGVAIQLLSYDVAAELLRIDGFGLRLIDLTEVSFALPGPSHSI